MDLERLALERVISIPPYPPGRPISAVAREFGLDPARIVKLASNENPWGMSPRARDAILQDAGSPLYPDFDTYGLRHALSERLGVGMDAVLPGAGSSEHIILVARAFLEPGLSAVVPQYAFHAYGNAIASVGARTLVAPARGFDVDLEAVLSTIEADTRVLYLATPNNPTGGRVEPDALEGFLAAVPKHVVVVLDEAYRDFLDPADQRSTEHWPQARPNLLVMRTFSKIHGLAGLRVAYAVGHPDMVAILRRLQTPFAVSALAEVAAVAALGDTKFQHEVRRRNAEERARVSEMLDHLGLQPQPSHGNFVLFRVGDGSGVYQALLRRGVIVRPVGNYGLPAWLRVSIGTPEQNDAFLGQLRAVIAESPSPDAIPRAGAAA